MKIYFQSLVLALGTSILMISCDKPSIDAKTTSSKPRDQSKKGELNRELAGQILSNYLSTPHIKELSFTDSGWASAESDAIVSLGGFSGGFTKKGLALVGAQLKENRIYGVIGGAQYAFELKTPISETISEITGIADGASPNLKTVECVTKYQMPTAFNSLNGMLFTGRKANFQLKLYDDGWRIVE